MSSTNPESYGGMEPLAYRMTERGLALILKGNLETGEFSTAAVTIDSDGAREVVVNDGHALDAYFHPNVTPGLEDDLESNPWDDALDAYNSLSEDHQKEAMKKFTRVVESGAVAPVILMDSVKRARNLKELNKAA